jgi:carbonic anhydrase
VLIAEAERVLAGFLAGNRRFREGAPCATRYSPAHFQAFGRGQSPVAAVVTCADSRVAPEVIFDQPLGRMLVARVPGNVASESARWMLDIAVGELAVPLVLVVGHTGCRAVQQVIEGKPAYGFESLQRRVGLAVERVRLLEQGALFETAIAENARQTVHDLMQECTLIRSAVASGSASIVPLLYHVEDGSVESL